MPNVKLKCKMPHISFNIQKKEMPQRIKHQDVTAIYKQQPHEQPQRDKEALRCDKICVQKLQNTQKWKNYMWWSTL